jgi:hypothetical protein
MKPDGASNCIGGKFAALSQFVDLDDAAAQYFRHILGPDSDVDLLVVMPVRGSKRNKAIEIGVALDDIRIPKDIIVTTPDEFAWRKEIAGTIEKPAAREGKVVYARPSVVLARRVRNEIGKHLPKERKKRGE